nr:ABC transporter substrate-binding protein [Bacteroidota bacterium]
MKNSLTDNIMKLIRNILPLFVLFTLLILMSCSGDMPEQKPGEYTQYDLKPSSLNPEFATGFKVWNYGQDLLLEIFLSPEITASACKYLIYNHDTLQRSLNPGIVSIQAPITKLVCMSASHVSFVDALQETNKIVGVSSAAYVVSDRFDKFLHAGNIREIGVGDYFDLEALIDLQPDVVMVSPYKGQTYDQLLNAGMVVLPNGDFLEPTPLGRAEWIKVLGILLGKEGQADSIFNSIKAEYFKLKNLTANLSERPTVICGKQYGGFWNIPGGNSYVACFLKDAGAEYLWSHNTDKGSFPMDFETVYSKGYHAEFWRFLYYAEMPMTYDQLLEEDARYAGMKAFKNNKVIGCNTLVTPYY